MSTPGQQPRPGPLGPDIGELRAAFDDLLSDSTANGPVASVTAGVESADGSVGDEQVRALDAAHELLAQVLTSLDTPR